MTAWCLAGRAEQRRARLVASSIGAHSSITPRPSVRLPYPKQAFFAWFSVAPLLPIIRQSLNLTSRQVHYSNLASVGTTIIARCVRRCGYVYEEDRTAFPALLNRTPNYLHPSQRRRWPLG